MAAARERGLEIGLKNDSEQIAELGPLVDFAVNEQCVQYGECGDYSEFLASGKPVFNVEYEGTLASICPGRPAGMVTVLAPPQLDGPVQACR